MSRVTAAWAVTAALAAVAVALAVALVHGGGAADEPTTVHLIAPPMAIFDAQGQVWLDGAAPPPVPPGDAPNRPPQGAAGQRAERRSMALRARVAELAAAIGDELTPPQQAAVAAHAVEASARHGELRAWEELVEAVEVEAPAAAPAGDR